jgi:hypothetical protein
MKLSHAFSAGSQTVPSLLAHSKMAGTFSTLKKAQSLHLASNRITSQLIFIARF